MDFGLLLGMGKKKAGQVGDQVTAALVNFDPETATEAQIDMMSNGLTGLLEEVAKARAEYQREQKEADEIKALYNQRLAAAEKLGNMLADESLSAAKRKSIEASLQTFLQQIEDMMPDVEREESEAVDAKALLNDLEGQAKGMAEDLKNARKLLVDAQRDIKKAGAEKERNQRAQERAEVAAGIKEKAGGINIALDAMRTKASETRVEADAAKMKTDLLKPTNLEEDDPNIAAAMAEVTGATESASLSVQDRLAALKKKK
ncbi:MAG: hypothetical protein OEM02_03730 [Desulfobulbaceae bacterium]|nr:hypothetical protein [Desulfobulbaceae bacterium]